MQEFDLVIRGGIVATASDVQRCDIGVSQGRVVALAENLPLGQQEVSAVGKLECRAESMDIATLISQCLMVPRWPIISKPEVFLRHAVALPQ